LKTNYLETSIQLHEGKNLHEMVKDIKNELTSEIKEEQFVPEWLKLKMGILFETKEMNPPYFFSWEFTAGTYAPILFPFVVTLLQMAFKEFKRHKAGKEEDGAKVKQS